jgi:hypothetical protein
VAGTCAGQCISDGDDCEDGSECCSGKCDADGSCAPLSQDCKTAGNSCGQDAECCSRLCEGNTCKLAASFCIQPRDACSRDQDCCSGSCIVTGGEVGTCDYKPAEVSTLCGDSGDGVTCTDCGDCCSRVCAPYAPTGVLICQPSNGCHVTGDFCRRDEDCCGGDGDSTLPGAGAVQCVKGEGASVGVCGMPDQCSPQGNLCDYGINCDGSNLLPGGCTYEVGDADECTIDALGVPRMDGAFDVCGLAGDICSNGVDCCTATDLCVPDTSGVLRCTAIECVDEGGGCSMDGDCCVGTICSRQSGALLGTCVASLNCGAYGQTCTDGSCCHGIVCREGRCLIEPL